MLEEGSFEIDNLGGHEFEELIKKVMKKSGYKDVHLTTKSRDMGKDIVMENQKGERILIECKHQKLVGRPVIQKLQGAINHEESLNKNKKIKGMVIISGKFSNEAMKWNSQIKNKIELIDGKELKRICKNLGTHILNGKVQIISNKAFKNIEESKSKNAVLNKFKKIYGSDACKPKISANLRLMPVCFIKYDVDFSTWTSIGCIDQYADSGHMAIEGKTGGSLENEIANFYLKDEEKTEEIRESQGDKKEHYEMTENDIENQATKKIIEDHSYYVVYTGRNNVTYTKLCTPKKKDIEIKELDPIYLPKWDNEIKAIKTKYRISFYVKKDEQYIEKDELRKCKICEKYENNYEDMSLCPECGRVTCKNHTKIDYLDKKTPICSIHKKPFTLFLQRKYFAKERNREKYGEKWASMNIFRKLWEDQIAFWTSIAFIISIFTISII